MKLKAILIGKARAIRGLKCIVKQCGMGRALEIRLKGNSLIVTPHGSKTRENWAAAAARMHEAGDDELLMPEEW